MNLEEKVNEELKKAVRSGDKTRLETFRSLRAGIIEFNKSGAGRDMNEEDEMKILNGAAKQRRDAIALYEKGGRYELADKERQELEIIQEFLPKQLSEEEITEIAKQKIEEIGASDMQDMGKVMGVIMKELKGQAEGSTVQKIVRELLGSQ